ncbi:hypothetical protein [Aurantimonas sp. 22II-16-19i]|uniref:hypothetical protein n=1 Tax=Aurantimonas sp. 22II-16-19i TaxID=1317114 RepID=UPI0009F7CFA3|nr:hypothetical protein [Aurantimonas sp. 22II-16-19i]ORE89740.1 hypothetical protein ATO4_23717 [Aurantimonas sp. 22II-16-19i]
MLTFPLALADLADLLPVAEVRWRLAENQELSGLGSGQILAAELGPALWEADVTLGDLKHGRSSQIQARLEALDGATRAFYLCDPFRKYPQGDPDGSRLGAAAPVIGSLTAGGRALSLSGLPAGYVLTAGDYLAFDYGSPPRRAFHRVVETATASGTGATPPFEVRPMVRTGAAPGISVTLIKPAMKCIRKPASLGHGTVNRVRSKLSFSVVQKL